MWPCCSPWWLSGINGYSHSCWTRSSSGAWPKERELLGEPGVTSSRPKLPHQNLLKSNELVLHYFWSKREGTGWADPGFCSHFPSVKAHQGIHMDNASCSHLKDLGWWKCKWQEVTTWILTFPASREMTQFACSKGILLILNDFIKQGPFIHFCMNFERKQRMKNELHSLTYINTN